MPSAHFLARIYGEVQGQPPFINGSTNLADFTLVKPWPIAGVVSLPTGTTTFYPLPNGYRMPNGTYVYSVIEKDNPELNQYKTKYVTDSTVATLATLAG